MQENKLWFWQFAYFLTILSEEWVADSHSSVRYYDVYFYPAY